MFTIAVNARFLSRRTTGVQRFAFELLSELVPLVKSKYRIVAISPKVNGGRNFTFEHLEDKGLLQGHLWEQIRLPILCRKLKVDLLWSPCNTGPLFYPAQVVTFHDASVFAGPEWFSRLFVLIYQPMFKILGLTAKAIITDSHFSKKELVNFRVAPENKIVVIPGAAMDPPQNGDPAPVLDRPFVLSVGSRDRRKNIKRLVDAWDRVPMDVKAGRLLAIAGGNERTLRNEGFEKVPADVQFLGYVPDDTLLKLYSQCDIFLYPSLYEGFGLPPLEAMKSGAPVLVSDVPALRELCGESVVYCDPFNTTDIADKISSLLNDQGLRNQLKIKGLKRASHYDWKRSAIQLLSVFDEILKSKGKSHV